MSGHGRFKKIKGRDGSAQFVRNSTGYTSSPPDDPPPVLESLALRADSALPTGEQKPVIKRSPSNDSLPNSSHTPAPESFALLADSISQLLFAPPNDRKMTVDNNSLSNDSLPCTGFMPESLAPPAPDSVSQPASTLPSGGQTVADNIWVCLGNFLRVLTHNSIPSGLLKTAMEDLAQCISMYEDAAVARQDYTTLKLELEALFGTLSTQFAGELPPSMTASMDNLCSAIQKELDRISSKEKGGMGGRCWEAKDLDEIMKCYQRIRGHLDRLTLNTDLSTWKMVDELVTEARLKKLHPAMSACYDSAEADQVRRRECTPRTRQEVLAELGSWAHDREQGKIYWLNGMAGTGKTTIATSLCAMLERAHELGASFFCTRHLPECRDVKRILPTIAYQLACFSRPFGCALARALEHDRDLITKALRIQFEGLIIGPLREVARTLPMDLVVVIDALDECDDSDAVERILEMLVRHAPELPIKVFVSSRPEPQIRTKIGSMKSQLVLHELGDTIVKGDIEIYLRVELALADISVSESQLSELITRAGVLFIYAAKVDAIQSHHV